MQARLPGVDSSFAYSICLCAGILTWGLFAEVVGRAQNIFIESANLLKKISFPRLTLPIIIVSSALLNFAIIFGLFTAFLLISGNFPGWVYLAMFPILMVQIVFSISLGVIFGVLNVFFSRCRPVFQHYSAVLVLADPDCLPDRHFVRTITPLHELQSHAPLYCRLSGNSRHRHRAGMAEFHLDYDDKSGALCVRLSFVS